MCPTTTGSTPTFDCKSRKRTRPEKVECVLFLFRRCRSSGLALQKGKSHQTDGHGQERTDCGSQSHREQGAREAQRGQVHPGHAHQRDGQNIVQKAQPGAAASTEVSAKAKVHTCKNAIENIPSQVLPAQAHNLCAGSGGIRGEQRHHRLRNELNNDRHDHPKAHS